MIPDHAPQPYSRRFQIMFWVLLVVGFFYFISLIKSILLPFVVGILTAYFLDPAVKKLASHNMTRTKSAAIITIGFFVIVIALFFFLVPLISQQLTVIAQNMPVYIHTLQDKYARDIRHWLSYINEDQANAIKDNVGTIGTSAAGWVGGFFSEVLKSGLALLNLISLFFITPIVVFYLLRDWNKVVANFDALLPRQYENTIMHQLKEIDKTLSGFIRGQTNISLIMSGFYSVLLSIVGLNFALGIGILSGFMLFIPFMGYAFCFALAVLISIFQFGATLPLLFVILIYLVGMFIESSILTPRLIGNEVGLHPLWIIFGVLAGAALFGFVGVLISVPLTAVAGVLVRFAIEKYRESSLYQSSLYLHSETL